MDQAITAVRRRTLIAGAAAGTVATTIGLTGSAAHAAPDASLPSRPYRIDLHGHFLPAAYGDVLRRHGFFFVPQWTPNSHIAFMDEWGIQASVVSASVYFDFGDAAETGATARLLNDVCRDLIDQHGSRFGTTVSLPMPYVSAAIDELNYAFDTLGLDNGVMLFAQYGGVYLGDPAFDALYRELDRRGCVVWVHPAFPDRFPGSSIPPWTPAMPFSGQVLEFPFETTRAAANIIYQGVLDRYPNIRWQLSHAGGTLPVVLFRLALMQTILGSGIDTSPVPGPFRAAEKFYYDTGVTGTAEHLQLVREVADISKIVYGSDWPFTRSLFATDAAQRYPWFADGLPQDGDPEPALWTAFGIRRLQVERVTPLQLYPSLAARL